MKTMTRIMVLVTFCMAFATFGVLSANPAEVKVGLVNFKQCAEKSKYGLQEQKEFETIKSQMESSIANKDKELSEVAGKLNDPDYMDGLTPEAGNELKHKYRTLNQEVNQFQSQYYQALNQANFKIVQTLNEIVAKAASEVAKRKELDLVINDEVTFFHNNALDISEDVIAHMDKTFDQSVEQKEEVSKEAA